MDLKVTYPEECDAILKEIKKGRKKKGSLNDQFADKHVSYNLDVLAQHGLLRRVVVEEDGRNMIHLEYTGKDVKFKQGRKETKQ